MADNLLQALVERIEQQDQLNREMLALQKETVATLKQLKEGQQHQAQELAKLAASLANLPPPPNHA